MCSCVINTFLCFTYIYLQISSLGQDMPTLEVWFQNIPSSKQTKICVRRSEAKMSVAHDRLEEGLYNLFKPVEDHLKTNFGNILCDYVISLYFF